MWFFAKKSYQQQSIAKTIVKTFALEMAGIQCLMSLI